MRLGSWIISFGLRGPSPQAFTPFRGGWVHCPAPEAPITRGMPTGPRAFLANSGRVWATVLRPVPPNKRPCAIHARKVGRASNTGSIIILHLFNCQVALCRLCLLRHISGQVRLGSWIISFGPRGPSPQAFTPFRGGLRSLPGP